MRWMEITSRHTHTREKSGKHKLPSLFLPCGVVGHLFSRGVGPHSILINHKKQIQNMDLQEKYMCGRMALLGWGVVIIVVFAFVETNTIRTVLSSVNAGFVSKEVIVKVVPEVRHVPNDLFQLRPDDAYFLSIGDADGQDTFDHIQVTRVPFHGASLEARKSLEIKEDDLQWNEKTPASIKHSKAFEWHMFSEIPSFSSIRAKQQQQQPTGNSPKILIAQYSNRDEMAKIFDYTKPVNMKYAEQWGYDIVFVDGREIPSDELNLASLLKMGWDERNKYDFLLLMDADAMMTSLSYDVARLIPIDRMVAAKRPSNVEQWEIYDTISVWDLSHLLVPRVAKAWGRQLEEGNTSSSSAGLDEQLKPYGSEIYRLDGQVGPESRSSLLTMDGNKKSDLKTLLKEWAREAKSTCKAFRIRCDHVSA